MANDEDLSPAVTGVARRLRWLLFSVLVALALASSLWALFRSAVATDDWRKDHGVASLFVGRDARCEAEPREVAATIRWRIVGINAAERRLESTVDVVLPASLVGLDGADGAPFASQNFLGVLRLQAGQLTAIEANDLPTLSYADGNRDGNGNWISRSFNVTTPLAGSTDRYPLDSYTVTGARAWLSYLPSDGSTRPEPFVFDFDCALAENLGWFVEASSDATADDQRSFSLMVARQPPDRIILLLIVTLSLSLGGLAALSERTNNINDAFLSVFTAIALTGARSTIVPDLFGIGTILDVCFYAIICLSALIFATPAATKPLWWRRLRSAVITELYRQLGGDKRPSSLIKEQPAPEDGTPGET